MIFVHLKDAEKILRSKTLNIAKLMNINFSSKLDSREASLSLGRAQERVIIIGI